MRQELDQLSHLHSPSYSTSSNSQAGLKYQTQDGPSSIQCITGDLQPQAVVVNIKSGGPFNLR